MGRLPDWYYRGHSNGWTAFVAPYELGGFSATAQPFPRPGCDWAAIVPELEAAQRAADGKVPAHGDCRNCGPWIGTFSPEPPAE
jgi:hypothetical protein